MKQMGGRSDWDKPATVAVLNESTSTAIVLVEYWWVDKFVRATLTTIDKSRSFELTVPVKPVRVTVGIIIDGVSYGAECDILWKEGLIMTARVTEETVKAAKEMKIPFIEFCSLSK